jgi:DNA repair exonuclease SbcCD ATPase subunit
MNRSMFMLLLIALCSCAQNSKMESADALSEESLAAQGIASVNSDLYTDPRSKLIKTAEYRFRVEDLKKSEEAIESSVRKFPAHISSSNLTLQGNTIETTMTIRVETSHFQNLLKEIDREAAHVHHRNIRTEDVAKQFVDLESRLKTKREVQERYKEILRTKAGKIEELLSAERQIGELQEEIEATVSKLNYLKDQVAYSTINLEFYQKVNEQNIAEDNNSVWQKFGTAFSDGLSGAVNILVALTSIWPLLLLVGGAFVLLRKKKNLFTINKSLH